MVYALTAAPVARLLGVTRSARTRPLLVGNDPWVVDLAITMHSAGLDVLTWTAPQDQRERLLQAGVELAPQDLLSTAAAHGVRLEDITALLLLTSEDDFNALAATLLTAGGIDGPIYRIAPPPGTHGVVHSFTDGEVLFGPHLSRDAIRRRYRQGAKILTQRGDASPAPDHDLLFRIRANGQLVPVLNNRTLTPTAEATDIAILLGPAQLDSPPPAVVPLKTPRA
jgi:hypothetical protein